MNSGDRGSGKSSVLRAVMGLAGPGGDITLFGSLRPGDPEALRRIGWAPQGWPFTYGLRAAEAITMVARTANIAETQWPTRIPLPVTVLTPRSQT